MRVTTRPWLPPLVVSAFVCGMVVNEQEIHHGLADRQGLLFWLGTSAAFTLVWLSSEWIRLKLEARFRWLAR